MKKFSKYILSFILSFAVALSVGAVFSAQNVNAEKESITYLSFGDSIAVGYALSGYDYNDGIYDYGYFEYVEGSESEEDVWVSEPENANFLNNSYAALFKEKLAESYNDVNAYNFACSGANTTDFLQILQSSAVCNISASADVVTVCIGANDLLEQGNIMAGPGDDILGGSESELEDLMQQGIDTFLNNITQVIANLRKACPNAKIIFTNVYNPYLELKDTTEDVVVLFMGTEVLTMSCDLLNIMGRVADVYIGGGTNSQGNLVSGLNGILSEAINSYNQQNNDNIALIDTKTCFDSYTEDYSKLVNVDFSGNVDFNELESRLDPHPTALGQEKMFNLFNEKWDEIKNIVDPEPTPEPEPPAIQEFDLYINGVEQGEKVAEGTSINEIIAGINLNLTDNQELFGWYYDSEYSNPVGNNDTVKENVYLYAKVKTYCKVYINGVEYSGKVEQGTKIASLTKPNGTGKTFDGWYSDEQLTTKVSEENSITEDTYLYYTWTYNIYVDGNLVTSVREGCEINNITKPSQTGKIFDGWYKDSAYTTKENGSEVTSHLYGRLINEEDSKVVINVNDNFYLQVAVNTQLSAVKKPTDTGVFDGWYKNSTLTEKYSNNYVITEDTDLYCRFIKVVCNDSAKLEQTYSENTLPVEFELNYNIADIYDVQWYVGNKLQDESTENTFTYIPHSPGQIVYVSCKIKIDGQTYTTNELAVNLKYSIPTSNTDLEIEVVEIKNKDTFVLRVKDGKYYDPAKFIWYRTKDAMNPDVYESFATGTEIEYRFNTDCNIKVRYFINSAQAVEDAKSSEIVKISVDNHLNGTMVIGVVVVIAIIGLIILLAVRKVKRFKEY